MRRRVRPAAVRSPLPLRRSHVAEQLERLEGLLQRGTLTQEEFDAQKQRAARQLNRSVVRHAGRQPGPVGHRDVARVGRDAVACTRFCEQPSIRARRRHEGSRRRGDRRARARPRGDRPGGEPARGRRGARAAGVAVHVTHVASRRRRRHAMVDALRRAARRRTRDADGSAVADHGAARRATAFVPIWRRPWMTIAATRTARRCSRAIGVAQRVRRRATTVPDGRRSPRSPPRDPHLVLLPSEPYPFRRRHVDEIRRCRPRRGRPRSSTGRTCSGGARAPRRAAAAGSGLGAASTSP